jgi:hypothetical protein
MILDLDVGEVAAGFDIHYGILPPEQLVIIRSYADDADDVMLTEIKPRYIVMYEPSLEFIRRIEVRHMPFLKDSHFKLTLIGISIIKSRAWSKGILHDVSPELRGTQISRRFEEGEGKFREAYQRTRCTSAFLTPFSGG